MKNDRYKSDIFRIPYGLGYVCGRAEVQAEAASGGSTAHGIATALLAFLVLKVVDVPDSVEKRVLACDDFDTLFLWIARATKVSRAEDIFTALRAATAE
ncbi:hypothetical protein ACFO4E_14855 [Nocardiopsis mangrovi]|uniref:Uncharacterized protein n=1 Tax=Nocardiopsis mangrovi TaxID=1179818 RepID=A0ABV9DXH9_9ACTN